MNQRLATRKVPRKGHNKTMKRKHLSKKIKKMKKVKFSRKKKLRGGAYYNSNGNNNAGGRGSSSSSSSSSSSLSSSSSSTAAADNAAGGTGSSLLPSGPLKNKGAALLYLLLNPGTMKKVRNATEKKHFSNNEKSLKMVEDILQYVENEEQLQKYIKERGESLSHQVLLIENVLSAMLKDTGFASTTDYSNFANMYYYSEVIPQIPDGFKGNVQMAIRRQFGVFLSEEIASVLDNDVKKEKSINQTLFKLSGIDDQIFTNIATKMKNHIVDPGHVSLSEIDLTQNYIAKDHFYELLKESIKLYTDAQHKNEMVILFREKLQIFQEKRKSMFDNIYQKIEDILKVTEDPVFVQTTVQLRIRQFNYYVTEMQKYAHEQLIQFYTSSGSKSILLKMKEKIKTKGLEIMTGIRTRLQNALSSAKGTFAATQRQLAASFHDNAIPHIVYGLTDRFIFDAFAKIASNRNEPFMSEETVREFKRFRDDLKMQIDAEKRQASEAQTASQPLSLYSPPPSPPRAVSQGNGRDFNNELSAARRGRSSNVAAASLHDTSRPSKKGKSQASYQGDNNENENENNI